MIVHLAGMIAVAGLITLAAFLPFLPGRYDRLAAPLSDMAQVFGFVGLAFVPIGALWLIQALGGQESQDQQRALKDWGRHFAIAAVIAAGLVLGIVSLVAFAQGGDSLGVIILALGACGLWRFVTYLKRRKGAKSNCFSPLPLYLVVVPTAVALAQYMLARPVAQWSRERVIGESAPMIDAIEQYRATHGKYPASLASLWNDYHPDSMGVERFRYEPSGDVYNLFFEHHTFRFGTQEIVMYNKRDKQAFSSHDLDLLELTPEQLELQRGHYAVHEAATPHWKYFWFD